MSEHDDDLEPGNEEITDDDLDDEELGDEEFDDEADDEVGDEFDVDAAARNLFRSREAAQGEGAQAGRERPGAPAKAACARARWPASTGARPVSTSWAAARPGSPCPRPSSWPVSSRSSSAVG